MKNVVKTIVLALGIGAVAGVVWYLVKGDNTEVEEDDYFDEMYN